MDIMVPAVYFNFVVVTNLSCKFTVAWANIFCLSAKKESLYDYISWLLVQAFFTVHLGFAKEITVFVLLAFVLEEMTFPFMHVHCKKRTKHFLLTPSLKTFSVTYHFVGTKVEKQCSGIIYMETVWCIIAGVEFGYKEVKHHF